MLRDTLLQLIEQSPGWLTALVQASLKATVLIGLAAVVVLIIKRSSASARHLVLTLSVAGALALPIFAILLPAWQLYVLPARAPAPAVDDVGPAVFVASDLRPLEELDPALLGPSAAVHDAPPIDLAPVPHHARRSPITWDKWLLALWLSGMGVVFARMLFHRLRVWQLRERARPITDERRDLAFMLMARHGLTRRVELLESDDFDMPITWGFLKPAVVLPTSSAKWPPQRVEVALLHELAHVRRLDAFTQLLAQIACAFYWFHPLTWFAALEMQVLREYACDAEVIERGTRPSEYAREVLGIVEALELRQRFTTATLPMAQRSALLKQRLLTVLSTRTLGGRLSRGRALSAVFAALALVLGLATMKPAVAAAPPAPTAGGTLPRLSPEEARKRTVMPPTPASPSTAPSPVAAPAPAPAPSHEDAAACADHERTTWESASKPERKTRLLIEDALKTKKSSKELGEALADIAHDERLDSEDTRQLYLTASMRLTGDDERLEVLEALLKGAPTTEQTAHGIFNEARKLTGDDPRADLLAMMHHIRESDLVRGPLAGEYLDCAGQLRDEEKLAKALQTLLHPRMVPAEATKKAMQLLTRVRDPDLRKDVLIEVTDHQAIDEQTAEQYRKLIEPMNDDQRHEALSRLAEAMDDGNRRGHQREAMRDLKMKILMKMKDLHREKEVTRAEHYQQQMEELAQAREQLREEADRVKEQALELDRRMKELTKELHQTGEAP